MFLSNDNGALQTQMNSGGSNPIAGVHPNSQISMHQHQQHQQQQQQQQLGQSQRMTLQQQPYSIQVRHQLTHQNVQHIQFLLVLLSYNYLVVSSNGIVKC